MDKSRDTEMKVLVIGMGFSKVLGLRYVSNKYHISSGNIINAILTGTSINGLCFDYPLENSRLEEYVQEKQENSKSERFNFEGGVTYGRKTKINF